MSVFFGQYDKTAQTNGATRGNGALHRVDEEEPVTPIPTTAEREATISALARQLTQGTQTGQTVDVFASTRSNDLDPSSPEFDPKKWVQGLSQMIQAEGTMVDRRLGLLFRDLSVYGYGSDAGESLHSQIKSLLILNRLPKDCPQRAVDHSAECSRSDSQSQTQSAHIEPRRRCFGSW
jgi:hypothetical protein